ncbi:acyltransferase family protein [uncultured Arthrobacter sp.]|uniref:acyltransferase family protein n=1 Tax=uncultured Arthrobacter sp. TaxID=114050 RepID=UPI0025FF904E|nr:acyltransferase family protein [uncultured Arthrobacter sp.]
MDHAAGGRSDQPPAARLGSAGESAHRKFRPEVQGLRAVAVLMVVTYHVWFDRVSGGVDVFLLISAFLMTLTFVRRMESGAPLGLRRHWARLFNRLLPAVVVVLLGTLAATVAFVPRSRWSGILEQTWSSLLYFQNWLLAFQAVDYSAFNQSTSSPLQHFWSLSIQGQVFILWPLLFGTTALLSRRLGIGFRRLTAVLFGLVFVVSLAFSIYETNTNQTFAYFDTRARLWEFALGTLLALALPYLRLPRAARIAAGWIGVAAMLSVGFALDVERGFPGYVALWPLLAAASVIVAGDTGSRFGADRILSARPLVKLGDISYALYLWHWPILVIYLVYRGREAVGPVGGTAIIGLSLVLAYVTTRFIETPVRNRSKPGERRLRTLLGILISLAVVATPVAALQTGLKIEAQRLVEQADKDNPGAMSLLPGFVDRSSEDAPPIPDVTRSREWRILHAKCPPELRPTQSEATSGACRAALTPGTPDKTILVIGDSKAEQWLGAILPMAEKHNYRVQTLVFGGCRYGLEVKGAAAACKEFNAAATAYAVETKPDVVFTVGTKADYDTPQEQANTGLEKVAQILTKAGIPLITVRDNPRFTFNVMECVERSGSASSECSSPLDAKLPAIAPRLDEKKAGTKVPLMDMTDLICPDELCRPVIGNVYVYLDHNHLTADYVRTMLPEFDKRFHAALDSTLGS